MPTCWSEPTTKSAFRLSLASLVITVIAAASGTALYIVMDSSLALVFGLESLVDFFSSVIVLWRFFAPFKLDDVTEKKLQRREKRACIAISFILVLLGISIISMAIQRFKIGEGEKNDLVGAMIVALFSIPVFGTLTVLKFRYAKELSSASLCKDGICSLIGTILAMALFVDALIVETNPDGWWIDPFIAMMGGFAAIWVGIRALMEARFREQLPIFTLQWWMISRGDESDEVSKENVGPLAQGRHVGMEMSPKTAGSCSNPSTCDIAGIV